MGEVCAFPLCVCIIYKTKVSEVLLMSVKVENLEKNMAKLTVEVDNAEFL